MMPQKVGLTYSRSSRDDGDETFSIDSQDKRNLEYAKRYDIHVPEEYVFADEYTGFTLNRPDFNTVQRLIEQRIIDCVIVYKVNRIARQDHLALWFLHEMIFRYGIELHIVEWGRPVRNQKDDILLYGLQAQFGQFDAMDIKERTARGRQEKAEQGIFLGQGIPVYGYLKKGSRKNTRLYIDENEATVITLIFTLYVHEQRTVAHILRVLLASGIPSPSQAKQRLWKQGNWTPNAVRKILRDERYTGVFYAFKHYQARGDDNRPLMRKRPREEWVKQEFPHLAIIDRDTWLAAQKRLDAGRDKWSFQPKHEYLLGGRQTCVCGYAVTTKTSVSKGSERSYYRCGINARLHVRECIMPTLHSHDVDALVWEKLEYLLRNPEIALDLLREAQHDQRQQYSESVINLERIKRIRDEHTQQQAEAYTDWKIRKLITEETYRKVKADLDQRLALAEKLYQEYQEAVDAKVLTEQEIAHIGAELANVADLLDELGVLEFAHKRYLVEKLDVTGTYIVEGRTLSLILAVHTVEFERIPITDLEESHEHQLA